MGYEYDKAVVTSKPEPKPEPKWYQLAKDVSDKLHGSPAIEIKDFLNEIRNTTIDHLFMQMEDAGKRKDFLEKEIQILKQV